MADITVRGRAEALLDPTHATVTVTVHSRDPGGQDGAVDRCARTCAAVDELVDAARGGLVRRATTSSLRTGPEYEHSPKLGRQLVAWSATRTTDLECRPDGPALTELLDRLGRMADVRLAGPWWHVAPDEGSWAAVRSAAAADARGRALAYADGLGVQVGRVVRITEPGLRTDTGSEVGPMAFAAARSGVVRGGGEEVPAVAVTIVPEPVEVAVEVDVSFALD